MRVSESVIRHVYALQGMFDLNTYVCRFLAKRLLSVGDFGNVVPVVSVLKFCGIRVLQVGGSVGAAYYQTD